MRIKGEPLLRKNEFCLYNLRALAGLLLAILVVASPGAAKADESSLWAALRDGSAFGIMRHALAPGFGDPENFDVDDCATQRNLSGEGRQQAKSIGQRIRAQGIEKAAVFSSAWCRCRETAELLGLGPVETLQPLNSFFRKTERRERQTSALKAWLDANSFDAPLILVTHQVNISALTGNYTNSGDIVVVRREKNGKLTVLGKL